MSKVSKGTKFPDYTCIRCGYHTEYRQNMNKHLHRRAKACPTAVNDIELTDGIKQHILDYRIYHIPKPEKKPDIIKNYNYQKNIMNVIGQMDVFDKIDKWLEYSGGELSHYHNCIDDGIHHDLKRIESGKYKILEVSPDAILALISNIVRVKPEAFDNMSIVMDKRHNELKMFNGSEWKVHMMDKGIEELILALKDKLLNKYEVFLIKKIYGLEFIEQDHTHLEEYLTEYYQFIANFNATPYVCELNLRDIEVVGRRLNEKNEFYLVDHYQKEFLEFRSKIKRSERNALVKKIIEIIKTSNDKNIEELDKGIHNIIQIDSNFHKKLFSNDDVEA